MLHEGSFSHDGDDEELNSIAFHSHFTVVISLLALLRKLSISCSALLGDGATQVIFIPSCILF